jgi:putative transposase
VWAFDFQFDQIADGKALKLLNVVDEFTREALVMHVDRSYGRSDRRGPTAACCPARRADARPLRQGPKMTTHALIDWCAAPITLTSYIGPRRPMAEPVGGVLPLARAR